MILFLISPAIIVAVTGYDCYRGKLTPQYREKIVREHNRLRSKLAKGTYKNSAGKWMPKGKNMMEMKWDCELELMAQRWADQCVSGNSPKDRRSRIGENVYTQRSDTSVAVYGTSGIMIALESWWVELTRSYKNNPSNKYTSIVANRGVSNFTQLAWGKTYKVGCGIATHCDGGKAFVAVCQYNPGGNTMGESIYEKGRPCKTDRDCSSRKCAKESGLCKLNFFI
uniref:ASP-2 protein n=1 Tax=Onchocerca volvulus TaxID=6282 RepID=Q86FX1_ONCVO|nr:ASP-2 protein [Onchocerca volvulus]